VAGRVTLRVTAGPIQDQTYAFDEHDTFIFGRGEDCHARLPASDKTASRHHFILEANPPDARLRDLGSLNGTYVNGVKHGGRPESLSPEEALALDFPEVDIQDGDTIKVGDTVFDVRVEVPAACCECGIDIPHNFKKLCRWTDGLYVCGECREKVEQFGPATKPAAVLCERCGKDAAGEVGRGRQGDYVCRACRATAETDPAAVLRRFQGQPGAQPSSPVREVVGYRVEKKLGQGGMGAVYLARRAADGLTVALKVMLSKVAVDDYSRRLFSREIDVTAGLNHPRIVRLYEHGAVGSAFYFALEYCPGGSVYDLMRERRRTLPLAEAGRIILDALDGLMFAHERGYIHRDIKPQNVLLTPADGGVAKLSDFGLAKSFQKAGLSGMTATSAVAGTFAYMPREQLTNFKYAKPVSDVWSIGATLYYMLTGQFTRDFADAKDQAQVVMSGRIVPLEERDPDFPPAIAAVVNHAIADDPRKRYQSAEELHRDLSAALLPNG
jgi:hypothetical protein